MPPRFRWAHKGRFHCALLVGATLALGLPSRAQNNWIADRQNITTENLWGVGFGNNLLMAVGEHGAVIRSDYDDPVWQGRYANTTAWLLGVAFGAGRWIVVGEAGTIVVSDDNGETWDSRPSGTAARLNAVAYGNGIWLTAGEQGTVLVSTDGNTWSARPPLGSGFLRALAFGQGRFLIGGAAGVLYTTIDGTTFTRVPIATTANIEAAAISAGRFFVSGSDGLLASSTDLADWRVQTFAQAGTVRGLIARGNDDASAVGDASSYVYSTTWNALTLRPEFLATAATPGREEAIAVGFRGGVARSSSLYGLAIVPGPVVNVLYGSDVTLKAVPAGAVTNVSYQWQRDGIQIPGATNSELSLRSVGSGDAANISVWGFASAGRIESRSVVVNVVPLGRPEVIDPAFNYGLDTAPFSALIAPDGKLFVSYYVRSPTDKSIVTTKRLLPSGSIDSGFNAEVDGLAEASFQIAGVLADGRIYGWGNFLSARGLPRRGLVRLNPDGSLDESFAPDDSIETFQSRPAVDRDGALVVASSRGIVRLLPSGRLDPAFKSILTLGRLVGVNSAGQTFVVTSQTLSAGITYPPQSTRSTVTSYRADGTSAVAATFTDAYGGQGYPVFMAGDWIGSTSTLAGKLYGSRGFFRMDTTGKSRNSAAFGPGSVGTENAEWFLCPDGSVWDLRPIGSFFAGSTGPAFSWVARLHSTEEVFDRGVYASLVDQADYHPLASAEDGSLYAVPNQSIASTASLKKLVHVQPIRGAVARLANLAVRARVTPAEPLIAGFVTGGGGATRALVRAVGPGLSDFGVTDALRDPAVMLKRDGTTVSSNDNWSASLAARFARLGAFSLPAGSRDAALEADIGSGNYTAEIYSSDGGSGTALVELYESADEAAPRRFVNVSARGTVSDTSPLVVGFTVTGGVPMTVLIRAAGPALSKFGVRDALGSPSLKLFHNGKALWDNSGWDPLDGDLHSDARTLIREATDQVRAFSLDPRSGDCAMVVTLAPGSYTAQAGVAEPRFFLPIPGFLQRSGVVLIEVYEVP